MSAKQTNEDTSPNKASGTQNNKRKNKSGGGDREDAAADAITDKLKSSGLSSTDQPVHTNHHGGTESNNAPRDDEEEEDEDGGGGGEPNEVMSKSKKKRNRQKKKKQQQQQQMQGEVAGDHDRAGEENDQKDKNKNTELKPGTPQSNNNKNSTKNISNSASSSSSSNASSPRKQPSAGPGCAGTKQQTSPKPSIPIDELFPDKNYPIGQIMEHSLTMKNQKLEELTDKHMMEKLNEDTYQDIRRAAEAHRQTRLD